MICFDSEIIFNKLSNSGRDCIEFVVYSMIEISSANIPTINVVTEEVTEDNECKF